MSSEVPSLLTLFDADRVSAWSAAADELKDARTLCRLYRDRFALELSRGVLDEDLWPEIPPWLRQWYAMEAAERAPSAPEAPSLDGSPLPSVRYRVDLGAPLGAGSFGSVFKGFDNLTGRPVAVKQASLAPAAAAALQAEFTLLSSLRHPNIVRVFALEVVPGGGSDAAVRLVMEWMPSGSVHQVVTHTGFRLHELTLRRYLRDALSGLAYLASQGIVHRDVKPSNMLVDAEGTVKLSDFGASLRPDAGGGGHTGGTACFMSPEAVAGRWSPAADLWALACSAVHMGTARLPWSHLPEGQRTGMPLLFAIMTARPPDHHPPLPAHFSPALAAVLRRCFSMDPGHRATAAQLLAEPYFDTARDHGAIVGMEAVSDYAALTASLAVSSDRP